MRKLLRKLRRSQALRSFADGIALVLLMFALLVLVMMGSPLVGDDFDIKGEVASNGRK